MTQRKDSGPIPVRVLWYVSWQPLTSSRPKSMYFCSLRVKPPRMNDPPSKHATFQVNIGREKGDESRETYDAETRE